MPRFGVAALALVVAASCVDRPPAWGPSQAASAPPTEACVHARKLRERAPALLDEGRLDRAARVLSRAEDLCPAEAPATWALRVRALAAMGRSAEAIQLAGRIERSDRAGDEARAAAAAARTAAEEHGRTIAERGSRRDAPELFDPADKRRAEAEALRRRGVEASRAGDHATAKKLFLEAWDAWHPDPRALVEAGIEARLGGARAEAQALWDRAAYDDAASALHPELSAGAPSILTAAVLAWSPAGDRIGVGGDDEVVVLDGELHRALRLHTGEAILALAFAADGGRIFAAVDGGVRVFDALTGAPERDLKGHRGPVRALAASPDGHTLASAGDDGGVRLWAVPPSGEARALHPPRRAVALAFDASGAVLAAAGEDGRVTLWDTHTGALTATLPARGGVVRALAFDGAALDVVGAEERVRWDVAVPRRARAASLGRAHAEGASIAVSAGGSVLAMLAGADLAVADLAAHMPGSHAATLATFPGAEHGGVATFSLSPGGSALAVVYRDASIAVLPTGKPGSAPPATGRTVVRADPVDALAAAPDGRSIAAVAGGRALVWRADGDRLRAVAPGGARALAISPDGRTLALGLERARVELYRFPGLDSPEASIDASGAVDTLAFSPDGRRIAAGTAAPSVQVFTPGAPGAETRALHLESGPVRSARFSPDGASVLVASREGLTLWNLAAREGARFVPYGPEPRDAALTPDGMGMVVADRRGELLLGKAAATAPAPAQRVAAPAQVMALAVGSDGTIVTAEGDRSIALRSPAGKPFQRFHDPDAAVRAIAILPSHVAAGLGDGSVRLYRAPAKAPVATLRPAPGLGPGKLAGVITAPGGQLEIVGPDKDAALSGVRCRLGPELYPLEVCAEQFVVDGQLALVLAGQDPAEADP